MYDTFEERKSLVKQLQSFLYDQFGNDGYNVFIYGSFFTEKFEPGKSDIDIAFYSEDTTLAMEIDSTISKFFENKSIEVDLLYINTNYYDMYVYVVPLTCGVELTDYYPEALRAFRNTVAIRQIQHNLDPMLV